MIISFISLLPIDELHAVAVVVVITIKPIPVRDKVTQLDVAAIMTNVSNDFNKIVIVFIFSVFLFGFVFLSLKYVIISLMLSIEMLKLFTAFNFFSTQCSKSIFSNGADGYNFCVFWSIYYIKTKTNFPK